MLSLFIVTGTRAQNVQHKTPSGVCPSGDQPCRIRTNLSVFCFFFRSLLFSFFLTVFVFFLVFLVLQKLRIWQIDILRLPRNRPEVSTPHLCARSTDQGRGCRDPPPLTKTVFAFLMCLGGFSCLLNIQSCYWTRVVSSLELEEGPDQSWDDRWMRLPPSIRRG